MAQVSVDTLNREGIVLVVDIEDMLPWKDHIQISVVSVRTIAFRIRGGIHYFCIVLDDLSLLTAFPRIWRSSRLTIVMI